MSDWLERNWWDFLIFAGWAIPICLLILAGFGIWWLVKRTDWTH